MGSISRNKYTIKRRISLHKKRHTQDEPRVQLTSRGRLMEEAGNINAPTLSKRFGLLNCSDKIILIIDNLNCMRGRNKKTDIQDYATENPEER